MVAFAAQPRAQESRNLMSSRQMIAVLFAASIVTMPLQSQSFRPTLVRDADNPARQPFAFVADLSPHGFATTSFIVSAQKRLVIEELDANGLNISATGTFIVS